MASETAVSDRLLIGRGDNCVPDLTAFFDESLEQKFDFIVVPLVHPRFRGDDVGVSRRRDGAYTRSDLLFDSRTWTTCVVGKVSPWLNLESASARVRVAAVAELKRQVAWATHLSVPAVLLPPPRLNCANYANTINGLTLNVLSVLHFWVQVPVAYPAEEDEDEEDAEEQKEKDPWEAWNRFRSLCSCPGNLHVALEITADLPDDDALLERWAGEPVKCLIVPTSVFVPNRAGYPTLARRHRLFVCRMMRFKVQFVVQGRSSHSEGLTPFVQYLDHLRRESVQATQAQRLEAPFLDYLQAPLQPLMDNLESQTYETFERDPVKYQQYEKAVAAALADRPRDSETVLMVVGAGRGPLVRGALRAADTTKRAVRVFAVEKNPNAVVTLRNMRVEEGWGDRVTVVAGDMRQWETEERADIMVSELLGSWGDNELSPECLDGAQRFLAPQGVSIPANYTSFLAPISSHRLWAGVRDSKTGFDTSYVVRLHNISPLAESQPVFRFDHPTPQPTDNSRYACLRFVVERAGQCHGFAGYFESQLYGPHDISINPSTHSPGMFSWFPLFIPLAVPVYVEAGAVVEVHVWRKVTPQKVWYEWCTTSPTVSAVHNANGKGHFIGL